MIWLIKNAYLLGLGEALNVGESMKRLSEDTFGLEAIGFASFAICSFWYITSGSPIVHMISFVEVVVFSFLLSTKHPTF